MALRARGEDDGVDSGRELLEGEVAANLNAGRELDALGLQLLEAAIDHVLVQLEIGDAVAEQAAEAIVALEDGDAVAFAHQLLRGGQTGGPGADHRNPLTRRALRGLRGDPAVLEGLLDDLQFDLLDRDRLVLEGEHAGLLAGSRADGAGELREVVGRVQAVDGLAEVVALDEVVPLGDQVAERAAGVAERYAAVHAAPRLLAHLADLGRGGHEGVVAEPLLDGAVRRQAPLDLKEALGVSHRRSPPLRRGRHVRRARARSRRA